MLRRKRSLTEEEFDGIVEEGLPKKSPRAMTTPGTLRLLKDLEELEGNATVLLEQNDGPSKVSMEYRVDQGFRGSCPNRFEVTVLKRYPHDPPLVRCLDDGFHCRFIDEMGTVMHAGLSENWTAICTLESVVQILQSIRSLFLNLQDGGIEPTDASFLFLSASEEASMLKRSRSVGEADQEDDDFSDGSERPLSVPKFAHYDHRVEEKGGFPFSVSSVEQQYDSQEATASTCSQDSAAAMAIEEA